MAMAIQYSGEWKGARLITL